MDTGIIASFIPESFFGGLAADRAWALWLLAGGAIALLVAGADRVVVAAVRLASVLGMSKVLIGATVVSLGTTMPEAFTSVTAAFQGKPGLALGNGIGSIICDTALIFGLAALIRRLPVDQRVQKRHGRLQLLAGVLLATVIGILAISAWRVDDLVMPRWIGLGFVVLLVGYLCISVRWARQFPDLIPDEAKDVPAPSAKSKAAVRNLLILAAGLAMVILGSNVLIGSASALCNKYGVPESIMAATLVAFGTSLPELVTAMVSLAKGHADLLIGNIMGADILNVLFVVGVSSAATELRVDRAVVVLLLPAMLFVLILLRVFVTTSRERMHRWHGAVLVTVYVAYCAAVVKFGVAL